jgi:hypothetical protein
MTAVLTAACSAGGEQTIFVVPGPTVPSAVQPSSPGVWDTDAELGVWANNAVSRGVSVEGSGTAATVKVAMPQQEWVLRGPDLQPAQRVHMVRITYRWEPAVPSPPNVLAISGLSVVVDPVEPVSLYNIPRQPTQRANIVPSHEWRTIDVPVPGEPLEPTQRIHVRYVYLLGGGWVPGTFTIDRIELLSVP